MKKVLFIVMILTFAVVSFSVSTTFLYSKEATSVYLVASFNNFEPIAMEKSFTGLWRYNVDLEPGEYLYKFIVDGERTIDFSNEDIEAYNGEIFNVRTVQESFVYPKVGDGSITKVYFDNERRYINPVQKGEIYLSIEFEKNDVEDVELQANASFIQKSVIEFNNTILYRFHVFTESEVLKYRFLIHDNEDIIYGFNGTEEFFEFDFNYPIISYFDIPEWSKGRIYYQIFPDRFRNGDTSNDPQGTYSWNGPHNRSSLSFGFYGGDLQGVIDSIDHLEYIGVEAIYFNPIFEAQTPHKYDTTDYLTIDDSFGDEEVFSNMIEALHESDIKVILDGVFNHTGTEFFAMKENFLKQEESDYLDWYYIKSFPIKKSTESYEGWHGYADLPQLNNENPEVKAYINQVIGKWMSFGIDGWRMDAVDQLPETYWSALYENIKNINQEALVVGEFWRDATSYFEDPSFDSVMNYIFRDAAIAYAKGGRAINFVNTTNAYIDKYPPQVLHGLWNLLGSHDTERILTALGEDTQRMKLAVVLQMTFIGSPLIYYGDEIGMTGATDPFCRVPFYWDDSKWNMEILDLYSQLAELRKESDALRKGDYTVLYADESVLIYERQYQSENVIIALNSRDSQIEVEYDLNGNYKDIFTGESFDTIETMSGKSFLVLVSE
ncbi:MAG: cyclomaltodextrinase / maltogenic alpha-amylase / neopullulanase [Petrotoga sp.]|nr:cyclomaltodextrinase / maltogenic alpha-amylase / neopullulanase [Petrotoga sp.]